jgi:hypothetical protein
MELYKKEFPSYPDLEPELVELLEKNKFTTESSWHNDVCPSFTNEKATLILYVDYPNKEEREFSSKRFSMNRLVDGEMTSDTPVFFVETIEELTEQFKTLEH